MTSFDRCLEITFGHEGGWSDDLDDRGGWTNLGVTQLTLARYNKLTGKTLKIRDLTKEQAKGVYRALYWDQFSLSRAPAQLRPFLFDWCVHAGTNAIRMTQDYLGVHRDGVLGPRTAQALTSACEQLGWKEVQDLLTFERMDHLVRIAQNDLGQAKFLMGWWIRCKFWFQFQNP